MTYTVTRKIKFDECNIRKERHVRSNLADRIHTDWCGANCCGADGRPFIGLQYIEWKGGDNPVRLGRILERTDVLFISMDCICNVFIEPDGAQLIQAHSGVVLSQDAEALVRAYAGVFYLEEKEFVDRERRFLDEKPWLQLDGLTPEQAVARLEELGWGRYDGDESAPRPTKKMRPDAVPTAHE